MDVINKNTDATKNLPEKRFSAGTISATIWKNETINKDGEKVNFRTVSFSRGYKDKTGEWKDTNILKTNDLPKATLVLTKAYEYMNMTSMTPN